MRKKFSLDFNQILTPQSTSTTTSNNNINSANTNNSENNTSRKLIPSSINKERNESEKCNNGYAPKQDVTEKISGFNLRSMEERNYLYCWRFDVSWIERSKNFQKQKN